MPMGKLVITTIITLSVLMISCGSNVQVMRKDATALKNYRRVFVQLVNSSGSVSVSGGKVGNMVGGSIYQGDAQTLQELESFKFELANIGFNVLEKEDSADAVVSFSIGQVRFDPLAGWIADQAIAKFVDRSSSQVVAVFRAQVNFVTPTTKNLINNLSKSIGRAY